MQYQLRPLNKDDLDIVIKWRNSDRIRNNMYNDEIIQYEEHKKWFHDMEHKDSEVYLLFLINHLPIGLVYFNNIDLKNKHCFWGFYIGDSQAPNGSGKMMGFLGLDFIFSNFDILKVYGEVLSNNIPSLRFHEKLGFVIEGRFKNHIKKKGKFHDVIRYALFKQDWDIHRSRLKDQLSENGFQLN